MPRRVSPVDRFLRLFADVRGGESRTVLLLALDIFLILTAYYFIKPVREALILAGGSAEWKSYSAAGQALLLLVAVPVYGSLSARLPRRRLINVVTFFFVACLGVFYLVAQLEGQALSLAIVFYLWVGIFNLMIVAQFWSFANDIYSTSEGERLFPIVAFGASAGAVAGSFVSAGIIGILGVEEPLIAAAFLLLLSLVITNFIDESERREKEIGIPDAMTTGSMPAASGSLRVEDIRRALEREGEDGEKGEEGEEGEEHVRDDDGGGADGPLTTGSNPFALIVRCKYLLLIALLMLFTNWVNTTGEYILGSIVEDTAAGAVAAGTAGGLTKGQYIGTFYSQFYGVVNVLGLLLQAFVVSRVIKYLGVRIALLLLPLIALGVYSLIVFYPILAYVRWAKSAENATDYSLQNTVRHVLFLPCTREQKYKAKQAIDSFFVRAGDVLSAVVVFVGTTFVSFAVTGFAGLNLGLVVVWLILAVLIGREYRRLVDSGQPPCA